MSNFDSNDPKDRSGRSQAERRQTQLLADLSKSIDMQHHNTSLMHEFGSAFDVPESTAPNTSGSGSVGQSPGPARADHQHGVEVPTYVLPVFTNGWQNFGGVWQGARYYKMNGRVWLEGMVSTGTLGASAFTIISGYRPAASHMIVQNATNTFARLDINADGTVVFNNLAGNANTWCSLSCSWLPV